MWCYLGAGYNCIFEMVDCRVCIILLNHLFLNIGNARNFIYKIELCGDSRWSRSHRVQMYLQFTYLSGTVMPFHWFSGFGLNHLVM
jgi:hypothetical protein